MNIISLNKYKQNVISNANKTPEKDNIKGVLLNTYIRQQKNNTDFSDFDDISNNLLILEKNTKNKNNDEKATKKTFDIKQTLKPLLVATCASIAGIALISSSTKLYSNHLATGNQPLPGDLPRSMNLLEETDLAIFRAIRNPNTKNVLGLIGVAGMSAVTLVFKNLIDGYKNIWIKKQTCDINKDFQENLIAVENSSFSGKLNVINDLLTDTTNYFKKVFTPSDEKQINFKNNIKTNTNENNGENNDKNKYKNAKTILKLFGGVAAFSLFTMFIFNNFKKTVGNLDIYKQRMTHKEIETKINQAVNNKDLAALKNVLKFINASENTMREHISKITSDNDIIQNTVEEIKKSEIYAQAPEALAGISEKIQYYCYVNEPRGHLYNWILNPENKFNKYLFLALSASNAVGYIAKTSADAITETVVTKENTNSELELRKKLISTEINNFKAKKISAIKPLIDNFDYQMQKGKPKEELKQMAENILTEIKNGPPYVYS